MVMATAAVFLSGRIPRQQQQQEEEEQQEWEEAHPTRPSLQIIVVLDSDAFFTTWGDCARWNNKSKDGSLMSTAATIYL
jgi:hypothetical protein